jgi:cell division protein FtsW
MKERTRTISHHKKGLPLQFILFIFPIILSIIGLIFVFESSSIRALTETGDSFHYLKLQMRWIGLGIVAMTAFSLFHYRYLKGISILFLISVIILLIAVLVPSIGHTAGGAQSWIDLGFFNVQPTEFAKVAMIIYLASWFDSKTKPKFLPFMILLGFLILLIMMQPDLGTAVMIFALSIAMYYLAGQDLRYLMLLFPFSLLGFLLLVVAAPYRLKRFTAFLNPETDPTGIGYHINQILISLSNGGILGKGFGASRQKYLFLPEAHTDSIFAIFGEEFGFVGSVLLIGVYVFLLYKLYQIYEATSDRFGKLLMGGIFSFFGLQIIINLGGMAGLMPLTGVPLPFISYGGSHVLISFMLLGIAINIAKNNKAS